MSAPAAPTQAVGWAAKDSSGVLSPFTFFRRASGDNDVTIKILYCGICHSDLHMIKNDWNYTVYPIVPGHEIVGIATKVGRNVDKIKVGNNVGVGSMVNSCLTCENCNENRKDYCDKLVFTYNSIDTDGTNSKGGYSNIIVVNEHFVVRFAENTPLDKVAPLLCAGITVYSPMKIFGLNVPGKNLGVVGLGGLGHIAVKFGKAFGMKVTVISSTPSKEKEAIEHLGADSFLVSSNPEQMQSAVGMLDGIINTVSATHQLGPLLFLLKARGKMIMVGLPVKPVELPILPLITGGKVLAGGTIGDMEETQEMIDFADKHHITADTEVISMEYVNTAMERLAKADVRYRFVIDIANTLIES